MGLVYHVRVFLQSRRLHEKRIEKLIVCEGYIPRPFRLNLPHHDAQSPAGRLAGLVKISRTLCRNRCYDLSYREGLVRWSDGASGPAAG